MNSNGTPPVQSIPCSACGGLIEVDVEAMAQLGAAYTVIHESCAATIPAVQRRFVVSIKVSEVDGEETSEELVGLSAEAEGATFVAAVPALERRLGELWIKVQEHAPVIDSTP